MVEWGIDENMRKQELKQQRGYCTVARDKEHSHPVREARKILVLALVLALIAGICFGAGYLIRGDGDDVPELSAVVVQHQLEQVSKLATARYNYTNMGQYEDSADFHGIRVPFSGKRFIVSYDGSILAGVDLKDSEVNITGRRITVTLPEAHILSHQIDEKSLKVFDETKNIFNQLTIENYNDFYEEQKEEMEARALSGGLLSEAEEQAELVVRQILGPAAENSDKEIVVKLPVRDGESGESESSGVLSGLSSAS